MYTLQVPSHSNVLHSHKNPKPFNFKPNIISVIPLKHSKSFNFRLQKTTKISASGHNKNPKQSDEDFVTRVLRQNPTQVEPKYLIGENIYNLKEKEALQKSPFNWIMKMFNLKWLVNRSNIMGPDEPNKPVYLKDLTRELKGEYYIPDHVIDSSMSEEKEFYRNLEDLPRMGFRDFMKHMKCDKVKMLTSNTDVLYGFRDFVVNLKETPGLIGLGKTKWAMRLHADQAKVVLKEYTGPRYEIERQNMASVGKLLKYPHPVAASILSRVMVEMGMLMFVMAVSAVIVGGFMVSSVLAVIAFPGVVAVYVIWPIVRPFFTLFIAPLFGIFEGVCDNFVETIIGDGGIMTKLSELYTFGGIAASFKVLKPIILVLGIMVILVRFTLSRRSKNFKLWDIWQSIEFSHSKADARVDGSTGVKFENIAGIDEAVEELQEVIC